MFKIKCMCGDIEKQFKKNLGANFMGPCCEEKGYGIDGKITGQEDDSETLEAARIEAQEKADKEAKEAKVAQEKADKEVKEAEIAAKKAEKAAQKAQIAADKKAAKEKIAAEKKAAKTAKSQ